MAFSDYLQRRKRLHCFVLKGQLLLCLLSIPVLLLGQSGYVASDSLRAEHLLAQGLEMRKSTNYDRSNLLLSRSALLFQRNGHPFKSAHCYNHISYNLRRAEKTDSAEIYAHKALTAISGLASEDNTEQILAYQNLGMVETTRAHYDKAMDWLKKAHRLVNTSAVSSGLRSTILRSLGILYDDLGNYNEALSYYKKSLGILDEMNEPSTAAMAKLYNNIGYTYANKGLHSQALEYYKKELELSLKVKDDMHPDVAIAFINVGASYYRNGDYGQAALYFQKSLKASLVTFGEEHETTIINYENLALCYMEMEKYDQAISNLERTARIKKHMFGPDHPDLAATFENMGQIYSEQENFGQAIAFSMKALNVQRHSLREDHPKLINTYNKTGSYFALDNQPDSALYYLNKAKDLALTVFNPRHPALAFTYASIAKVNGIKKQYEKAISHYQQALSLFSDGFDPSGFSDNPAISEIQYPVYTIDILFDKAEMLRMAYAGEEDITYLKASLSTFESLSRLLDNLQVGYVNEQSKLVIGRKSHNIYEHAIQTAYTLYRRENNPDYLEQIFFFAEKSKARILLESVVKNGAKQFVSIPDSLLEYERSLERQINAVRQKMDLLVAGAPGGNKKLSSYRDSLLSLNRRLSQYTDMLSRRYPRYHKLRFANHIPAISHAQKRLAEKNLAIVEYFLGEESLFAIVMTENNLTVKRLSFDAALTNRIQAFNQAITQRSDSSYHALGYQLYQTFIEPIISLIPLSKRLLIVPDGEMALLPFEALLTRTDLPADSNHRYLPYLLLDYDISYAPSLALSTALQAQKNQTYETDFLAFAPGFTTGTPGWQNQIEAINRSSWKALPFSKLEVTGIASLFNERQELWDYLFGTVKTRLLLDKKASEATLKSAGELNARYIHLATHAFVSDDQSKLAGILLYPDKSLNEDGILFAQEVYNLSMKTDLVVLSACETGKGSVMKGEGIMSLSRAFQFAGAKNLLVSLWKVGDRSSAKLMVEFYRHLLNGKDKVNALQEAKKSLVRGIEFAHPFYWAPFVLMGN